jgi:hypothetical protein
MSAGYFMKPGSIPGLKVGRDELTEEATRQIEGDRSFRLREHGGNALKTRVNPGAQTGERIRAPRGWSQRAQPSPSALLLRPLKYEN